MKLHHRVLGDGEPLIILHGLFGSSDNWQTLAKRYAEDFEVYLIDQRNHGHSPHSDEFNYDLMSDDLLEFVFDQQLMGVNIIGHSMGGKTAMFFAKKRPELIHRMVVADMGVKGYKAHHTQIIAGLKSIDFNSIASRRDVDKALSEYVPEIGTRSFLMKGLHWKEKGKLAWRMNVDCISKHLNEMMIPVDHGESDVESLFITGGESDYLPKDDYDQVLTHFPDAEFIELSGAGHWLHVDQTEQFFDETFSFLTR